MTCRKSRTKRRRLEIALRLQSVWLRFLSVQQGLHSRRSSYSPFAAANASLIRLFFCPQQKNTAVPGLAARQENLRLTQGACVRYPAAPTVAACSVRFLKTGNLPVITQVEQLLTARFRKKFNVSVKHF